MAALFKQPDWSIEEVVLLALASEDISAMNMSEEEAATILSQRLRCGAELMGISIGQRYRNPEEVRNNLKLMASMRKMIGFLEDEYFEGSTIGHIALLAQKERERFNALADTAIESYPVIIDSQTAPTSKESYAMDSDANVSSKYDQHVAEPSVDFVTPQRKRRPRISEVLRQYKLPKTKEYENPVHKDAPVKSYSFDKEAIQTSSNQFTSTEPQLQQPSIEVEVKKEAPLTSYQKHLALIKQVLVQYFQRGFRLNSAIDMKRFRAYYKTMHDKPMQFTDANLEDYIRKCGFEYDGKVYVLERVMSSQLAEDIKSYIRNVFVSDRGYIFYKALYSHFEDALIESYIADVDMLKCWLQSSFDKSWHFTKNYIARNAYETVSVRDEVLSFIRESHAVITLEQLKESLNFLPEDKVEHEWNFNDDLISNGRNLKFHIDTFEISASEREKIAVLIATYLQDHPFITGEALIDELRMNLPEMFANNTDISSLGVRKAIAYHLRDRFAFRNNIISASSDCYDGATAMVAFCKDRGYFTVEEAEGMADVIGSSLNVYLERISEVSIRVNDTDFVPLKAVNFDVEGIDKALDIYINGDYAPLISLENFEAFPSCGEYPWNSRLLESYLLTARSRYAYYHSTFLAKDSIAGAVVKKSSNLQGYDDVLIQAMGESDIPLNEVSCNDYLYEIGLIARRQKNGPVKGLLLKAKECRNRIIQKKN